MLTNHSKLPKIKVNYYSELEDLKPIIDTLSSNSSFEDNVWYLNKTSIMQSVSKGKHSLYFTKIPRRYLTLVKMFALIRLSSIRSVGTVQNNLTGINFFFSFLEKELNNTLLKDVNKKVIIFYQEYLRDYSAFSDKTKESYWTAMSLFFSLTSDLQNNPSIHIPKMNPFSSKSKRKKGKKEMYIEPTILNQLDQIFNNKNIPLVYRTAYWICRLIPSRITEVCSMPIDCIKPYIDEQVISIPMFKQNGAHREPEIRLISLKEVGMGKYLLDLIREQKECSEALQKHIRDTDKKNFLLTYIKPYYLEKQMQYKEISFEGNESKNLVLNLGSFNRMIKKMCKRYNVTDSKGNLVNISSHMLRHVGITDRLYEGFRLIDIMSMTNHKSTKMITDSYLHVKEDELKKQAEKVLAEDKSAIHFRGRIINTGDQNKINQILKRPFAHKIGRLGVCSDISNCPSEMFECLSCKYFIPNADEIKYFQEQVDQWGEKLKKCSNQPFVKENAIYNLNLNKQIVERILKETESLV